jgi:hypothetical protein
MHHSKVTSATVKVGSIGVISGAPAAGCFAQKTTPAISLCAIAANGRSMIATGKMAERKTIQSKAFSL